MSYADNVLRRRQEMERAFRERYNPMEDVVSALSDIDKEAFRREQIAAEEKRSVEKYGLEKERIIAQTKKAQADYAALDAQRRAREQEFLARAARQREETRLKEQEASLQTAAEHLGGLIRGRDQTTKDIYGRASAGEAEKSYATRMARALATGTPEEVAKLDEELAAAQKAAPKAVPGGVTMEMAQEIADAYGAPVDAVMARIMEMEQGIQEGTAKLGLTGAQTDATRALERLRDRQGLPKPPKEKTPEEIEAAKEEAAYKRLRNERLKRALSEKGGFVPTEEEVNKMQTARRQVVAAQASTNVLRQLMNKYSDFKSYVGPVDGLINRFKAKFGANSREAAEVQSAINRVFQAYKVATTGAAAGVLEMEDLKNIMPKETDNFDAILGKLDAAERMAQTSVDALDLVLDKMDIRAADPLARGIAVTSPSAAPAAPKKAPSASVTAAAAEAGVELE